MKLDSQDGPQLATYARYNALLEKELLSSELGIKLTPEKIEQIAGIRTIPPTSTNLRDRARAPPSDS